ncbi:MAG TPA: 9-O-acetylesterase, partial [Planctomycetaceae bacterium]|nr:9-O-acetylesterase [Planctomycetaceae bacterium]
MKFNRVSLLAVTCYVLFCFAAQLQAEVRLPHIFGDHMVLQRGQPVPIWGWADPGNEVSVKLGTSIASTVANASGEWMVRMPPQLIGDPVTLMVREKNTITFSDVLIGEVWLCSGQSNMEWPVSRSNNFEEEKAAAN